MQGATRKDEEKDKKQIGELIRKNQKVTFAFNSNSIDQSILYAKKFQILAV